MLAVEVICGIGALKDVELVFPAPARLALEARAIAGDGTFILGLDKCRLETRPFIGGCVRRILVMLEPGRLAFATRPFVGAGILRILESDRSEFCCKCYYSWS